MATKQRFVSFYSLVKSYLDEREDVPASDLGDLFTGILTLDIETKIEDIKDDKFMYLESASKQKGGYIVGYFVSAKTKYRADLVDRKTGKKRRNPKTMTEGEQVKTHFAIHIEEKSVKLVIERNFYGISAEYFVWYLNKLNKFINPELDYRIYKTDVPEQNFLKELKRLKSIQVAEIYVDKEILGAGGVDFSDRIASIRHQVLMTVKSDAGESIKNFAIDAFNKVNAGPANKRIERLRLYGKDDEQNDARLDSLNLVKKDSAPFDVNAIGEVETPRALTILKGFLNQFDVY